MIAFLVVLATFVFPTRPEGCNIQLFRTWDPVVFSTDFEIIYPSVENLPGDRNITLPVGATIIISCHGGYFSDKSISTKTILATCNQDSQLEAQDKILDFDKLDCVNFEQVIAKVTPTSCAPNGVLIDVGFQIGLDIKFVPQIKVCFDVKKLIPIYVHHNLTKSIGFIKSYLTTSYVFDAVYNVSVDFATLYDNVTYQEQAVNKLLGLSPDSTKYVNPASCSPNPGVITTPGFCFSKRPLSYRGNFVYIPQQSATYRYINVAPQWYFIDYNLDKLEDNIIDFVKNKKVDLGVYTGTHGVATLPHASSGEEIELFLYTVGQNNVIPLPLYFWKLIYDPITLRATVFITINNPHLRENDVSKYVICNDMSDEVTWLTWQKHNVTKGYSYACSYEDAKAVIPYLPNLVVTDNLV